MIVKKQYKCSETGKNKISYTSDKPGYKIVISQGQPQEIKMSKSEITNRNHGENTNGYGARGSKNKQKGQTKVNIKAAKRYRDKQKIQEKKELTIDQSFKEIESLKQKLRKAKLKHIEMNLIKREDDLSKKEKKFRKIEKYVSLDKQKLKNKHSYYLPKSPEIKKIEQKTGHGDNMQDVLEDKLNIVDRLKKITDISDLMYGDNKKSYDKGNTKDIISKLNTKIKEDEEDDELIIKKETKKDDIIEAPDDKVKKDNPKDDEDPFVGGDSTEENDEDLSIDNISDNKEDNNSNEDESTDEEDNNSNEDESTDEEDTTENDDDIEDGSGEEGEIGAGNEIQQNIDIDEYNVDTNNAYEFYDYIIDKLTTANATKAINSEYNLIPIEKRKVISATEFYKRAVKRLDMLNNAESERMNTELEVEGETEGL